MFDIPPALAAHLGEEVTTLATCWKIVRRDGVILGFTTLDRDLTVAGQIYRTMPAFRPSAISGGSGLAVDNMEIEGALTSGAITRKDLDSGRYDFARIEVFLVNWQDPDGGVHALRHGALGEVRIRDEAFVAEVRGLKQKLQSPVGEVYSPECRADLGDVRCGVALRDFTVVGAVTSVAASASFSSDLTDPDDWFHYGRLRWLTGANAGLDFEVKAHLAGDLTLNTAPPAPIQTGDRFETHAGCDKRLATCRDKFDNVLNFRGEPFIPGIDSLLNFPGLQ